MDFEICTAVTVAVVGADRRQSILDSGAWECMAHAFRWASCAELIQHAQLRRLLPTVRCAAPAHSHSVWLGSSPHKPFLSHSL